LPILLQKRSARHRTAMPHRENPPPLFKSGQFTHFEPSQELSA
jgi:hypothetical protein